MKKTCILFLLVIVFSSTSLFAQRNFNIKSPDGSITVNIEAGAKLQWSVQHKGQQIIAPSAISLTLQNGNILGDNAKIKAKTESVETTINTINFVESVINDVYNQVTLNCKGDYGVIFRVYDDAIAYRFFTKMPGEIIIKSEEANFNFTEDYETFIPYSRDEREGKKFNISFEALYDEIKFSEIVQDSLVFLPLLVDVGQNKKVELFEVDLEDYPGMFVEVNQTGKGFKGVFAPYPLEVLIGNGNHNLIPTKSADYIAKTNGTRSFPWRAIVISEQDKDLLNSYIVQKLASPSRIKDPSWIKVGQVAWEWWNGMNISGVDFKAGWNFETYKYYIDFAAKYNVPYIMLDGGWNVPGDLTKPRAEINLEGLIAYGNQKGVKLMVWSLWREMVSQMEKAIPFYEEIGIKGMKIDFVDRDDQLAVASLYDIARLAAEHHLLVDYHGVFKPTGLQRTYPNVVGYEGVYGLENFKGAPNHLDMPRYCVTIPFIRNQAGPMDYTSGAMRNATKENYRPVNSMPMAQGTRVNQMAQFVVFEVPIQMLSDNPTIYMREHECTDFITKVPTTFDETVPLDGKVAEFVSIARRKGNVWFVSAMTNWSPRELTIDFSFLGAGKYTAEIFKDGINADRDATDYKKEVINIKSGEKLNVKLMNGGGWVARISAQKP